MKKNILSISFVLLMAFLLPAQPLSLPHTRNFVQIPKLPPNMTFQEYQKLKRTLDWKKVFEAAAIPGYIHFYTEHKRTGWLIFSARILGYAMAGYGLFNQMDHWNEPGGWFSTQHPLTSRSKNNFYFFMAGIALNIAGFAFDWAHGDLIIEQERNQILYKYGLEKNWQAKLGIQFLKSQKIPRLLLTLNF